MEQYGPPVPWYDWCGVQIHVGHVLDRLADLPAASIQCVVTSPPYWGLRSYDTHPQVWGGAPDCVHEWGDLTERAFDHRMASGATGTSTINRSTKYDASRATMQATCMRCGAWRGELGTEPLHDCLAWARAEEPCALCYVCHLVTIFRAIRRVLRPDGICWLNLGDSYAGSGRGPTGKNGIQRAEERQGFVDPGAIVPIGVKAKDLVLVPARVALALQADGWYLRQDVIWHKANPLPDPVTDRPTTAHEHLFLLSQRRRYFYDADAIREPGAEPERERSDRVGGANGHLVRHSPGAVIGASPTRNRRSVWYLPTEPYPGAHFATFPRRLVQPCILAGTSEKGACPRCGMPWHRLIERGESTYQRIKREEGIDYHEMTEMARDRGLLPLFGQGRAGGTRDSRGRLPHWGTAPRAQQGWAAGCTCDAGEPEPQIVLDPFLGSGTTAWVARHFRRRAIGIELNAEYAAQAMHRLRQGVLL